MTLPDNKGITLLTRRDFPCSVCSNLAGSVSLEMRGQAPGLVVSSFVGHIEFQIRHEAFLAFETALSKGSAQALFEIDPEAAPFFCPKCDACYCSEHWTYWDVIEEDGWFDSTRGTCFQGHERMLSD